MSHCGGYWVQVGVRRLRSPKAAGTLYANPCCIAEAACRKASAPRATSLPTLGAVRCASGASYAGGIRGVQPRLVSSASPAPSSLRVQRNVPAVLPSWSFFSTSTDSNSKEQSGSTPDKERDEDVPIAEADVAEVDKLTKQEPRHAHIEMPSITEAERTATLTSWHVQVGDAIEVGDVVCEIELEHFHVGVKVETPGFLAEILVEAGTEGVPVGADIGTIVHSEEDIALYQQAQGSQAPPASEEQEVASELEESFSWKDVLKHVLRLRNDNKLSEVEASDLMALARNKDVELLQAFEGCFDGEFQGEIDYDLFLAQAKYIAKTRRKA